MSGDSAYGSKGWEFESLRARFSKIERSQWLGRAAKLQLHAFAALLIAGQDAHDDSLSVRVEENDGHGLRRPVRE